MAIEKVGHTRPRFELVISANLTLGDLVGSERHGGGDKGEKGDDLDGLHGC